MFRGNVTLEYAIKNGLIRASGASDRPSSCRNTEGFCYATGVSLRSVLHHKVGLPLACYLHGGGSSFDDVARLYFPNYSEQQGVVGEDDHDKIFEESFNDWWKGAGAGEDTKGGEKAFAKMLAERVHQSLGLSRRAWGVKDDVFLRKGRTRGYVGVLVQCHRDNDKQRPAPAPGDEPTQVDGSGGAPVLLVEVGLENEEWWTKLNHGYQYLRCLENLQGPLLLAAVTFEPRGDGTDPLHHRIGVFLATPTGAPKCGPGDDPDCGPFEKRKFATSLLWRSQATSVEKLSQGFGRVLRAARLLVEWDAAESSHWCLGPNCCLLFGPEVTSISILSARRRPAFGALVALAAGDTPTFFPSRFLFSLAMLLETAPRSCFPRPIASQPRLLRAYDSRLVYTNRRQDVYLKFFKDTTEVVVEYEDRALATVNHDEQAPETLPFGTFQKGSDDRDWLWSFRGRFSVLSVPYHLGRHWTHEISEFIPVLEQLRSLHREGFVHGDIRCSNIAFAKENDHLIDFDLGGEVGGQNPPRFPANYAFHLPDGDRHDRPRAAISAMDDVYAMTQVVLECHDIRPPPFDFGESKPSEHLTEGTSLPPKNLKIEDEIAELLKRKKLCQERDKLRQDWMEMLQTLAAQEDADLTEGTSLPPKKLKLVDDLAEPQKAEEVGQAKERLLTSDLSVDEAAERRLSDLVAFLKKVQSQNWTVRPDPAMLYTMKRWGFNVFRRGRWREGFAAGGRACDGKPGRGREEVGDVGHLGRDAGL
jgi:hypothetical protein